MRGEAKQSEKNGKKFVEKDVSINYYTPSEDNNLPGIACTAVSKFYYSLSGAKVTNEDGEVAGAACFLFPDAQFYHFNACL